MSRNWSYPRMIVLLAAVLLMTACDRKRYFEENRAIAKGVWNSADKARFEVPVTDTLVSYDFFLNVRNSTDYKYSNIYLFIHTTNPAGKKAEDTVDCPLADYTGKWLGSGFGSIKFNRFFIQHAVKMKEKGRYVFEIEQAMRDKELNGILDIGLRIEKFQEQKNP
jgi:gliding motility-associated lipoprotein GldH